MDKKVFKKISMILMPLALILFAQKTKPSYLASCGNNEIKIWNLTPDQDEEPRIITHKSVMQIVFGPESEYRLASCGNSEIKIWNLETGDLEKIFTHKCVFGAIFNEKNSGQLISWSGRKIKVWDLHKDQKIRSFNATDIEGIILNPDNQNQIIFWGNGEINIRDLDTGQNIKTFRHANVEEVILNENQLISSSYVKNTIKIWDLHRHRELKPLLYTRLVKLLLKETNPNSLRLAINPENPKLLAFFSHIKGTVGIWNLHTSKTEKSFTHKNVYKAIFNQANPSQIATFAWGCKTIKMWNIDETQDQIPEFFKHKDIKNIAFQPTRSLEEIHREDRQEGLGFLKSLRKEQREREEATGEIYLKIGNRELPIPRSLIIGL